MTSTKPRNQKVSISSRKNKIATLRAPLSRELHSQYGVRTASIRKGDTVSIIRGDYAGHEGKVVNVLTNSARITVEGVNQSKLDGTNKPVPICPSKVRLTKLDLTDKRRKNLFETGKKPVEENE